MRLPGGWLRPRPARGWQAGGIWVKPTRPMEKGRRSRPVRLGREPSRSALELGRNGLVGPVAAAARCHTRRSRSRRLRRCSQRQVRGAVDRPAVATAYDGRSHERMSKSNTRCRFRAAAPSRGSGGVTPDVEHLSRTPEGGCIAGGIGGRQQHESLCRCRQRLHAAHVVVVQLTREADVGVRMAKPPASSARLIASRQLHETEGISAGLGHDPVAHLLRRASR